MKILPNQSATNFTAKSLAAQNVLRQFDKDVSISKYKVANPEKKRFVLEKLMQGFNVPFLVEALNISKHKVYELSTKYNARRVYMQDRDNIILKRLLTGEKRTKIAKEMDIDVASVNTIAEDNNTYRICKAQRDNLIKEKFLKGMKIVDIAKEFNIAPNTVSRNLKKMGIKKY